MVVVLAISGVCFGARVRSEVGIRQVAGWEMLKCDFHMHTVFFGWGGVADGAGLRRLGGRD